MSSSPLTAPPDAGVARCPFDPAAAATLHTPGGCPVSPGAASFDPFSDGYQQDPPEYLRWARAQEPVFYSPQIGYWVVTRYDDVKSVFRDPIAFSPSIALEKITPTGDEANAVLARYGYAMNRTLVNEDEPAHMARRRVLMEPFTPEALRHHEDLVRRITREYIDRFIDDGRADLVDQMLWEVPLTIALHFLGVPEEDMEQLRQYSIAHTVNTWGRPRPEQQVQVAHAVGNFWQLAGQILDKMRQDPSGPGWMKYGIRQQALHPEVVTDSYLHSMMMAGIVAAHETTANATANALKLLLQHPRAWRELCEDRSLIPGAVEECLRHNGSVAAWRRLATRDVQIGGIDIPAGSKLLIVMASANHDERRFSDPDLFDIRRDDASEHLTFGYGVHQCMGKNLARMELQIFLDEFARRLPHMRLSEQTFSYLPNTSFRGPEHLWVEWDPAANPERQPAAAPAEPQPVRIGEPSRHAALRPMVVERRQALSPDTLSLRLRAADGRQLPNWAPGAHIDVLCGDTGLSRQYSLCGDPAEASVYEIAVLRDPASRGGSTWLHSELKEGDTLRIRGPRNHFHYDESSPRVLLLAGGIGITPIRAMARRAAALGQDYQIHYCGRSRAQMAYLAALQAEHGERLHVHASDEGQRLDLDALLRQPQPDTAIYACGPERLLQALESACAAWPEDAVHTEHFQAQASVPDPGREHSFELVLKDSGLTLQVPPDRSVLSVLRAANIDVQSDCGEGLCGSCELRVLEGEVDHRDRVLTRSEREANDKMMACCSRACGPRLVLAL